MNNTDARTADGSAKPIHADSREELDEVVRTHDRVLVDIYRKGCSLCAAIEPVLGNVARVSDVTVVLYNPENDVETIEEWNVRSVPTLLLFEGGELADRMAEGFQGTESILEFAEE